MGIISKIKNNIDGRKDQLINGCGPWWVPRFMRNRFFSKQCNLHDIAYSEGGDKRVRDLADINFLVAMKDEINRRKNINQLSFVCYLYRSFQMHLFYRSVAVFGKLYFKKSTERIDKDPFNILVNEEIKEEN